MSGQIPRPKGSIALVATLVVWIVSFGASASSVRADDCLAEPNSPAPAGSHWYYHMDRATQRKCWYLRATAQPVEPAAAQTTSDPASGPANLPPAAPIPVEKPATASADAPISINPADSTALSPRIKERVRPQRASTSGAATGQPAQQGAQKATPQANPASLIQAPAPQPIPAPRDQGATTRSGPTPAWPDPPAITPKTQEPAAPLNDTRTEFTKPTADTTADTPVSDDAKSTVRDGASTTNTTGTTTSASMMPIEMLAFVALGLVVAGILLRVVMKISVMKIFPARRQPITSDQHDFDRIDDLAHEWHEDQVVDGVLSDYLKRPKIPAASDSKRRPSQIGTDRTDITRAGDSTFHVSDKISMRKQRRIDVNPRQSEWSEAQPQYETVSIDPEPDSIDDRHQDEGRNEQHGSVSEADELLHDLQSSLIAAASEYRAPPSPLQADDGWSNDGRGKDGPSQIGNEIKEREEVLERLRHDLDRLLQSPKVA